MSPAFLTVRLACVFVALCTLCPWPLAAAPPAKQAKEPPKKVEATDDARQVAQASNAFAFDLYAQLRQQGGNLFYSPANISTALAMTYAGAAGKTHEQMAETLHFDLADRRVHAGFGTLAQILNAETKNYRLQTANRLWGAKGYPFLPKFLAATRDHYGAELSQLNFAQTEPSRQTINRWVEQQTAGKIANLIPPGVIDADTRLVLTSAIYFKGAWQEEFWKNATQPAAFHHTKSHKTKVPMMHQSGHFGYSETQDVQSLQLPYAGGELTMIVVLPKEIDGLDGVERQLTAEYVDDLAAAAGHKLVEVYLPKFKLTSQFKLAQTLSAMGMESAFSSDADFSGISAAEGVMLSEVIHKAFVDVSEEGTEAAAATAGVLEPTAAPISEPETPVVFRANHPFAFMIRDNRTQAVLFLGRLADPATGG